ncbi:MAG: AMP-dependent synthetase/ligase [Actinomycetes bacterium]
MTTARGHIQHSPRMSLAPYPVQPVTDDIVRTAELHPGKIAMIDGVTGAEHTYAEIVTASKRLGRHLQDVGVGVGDRVAIVATNSPEWAVVFLGTLFAGGTVTTLNPLYTPREIGEQFADSEPKVVFAIEATMDNVRAVWGDAPHAHLTAEVWELAGAAAGEALPVEFDPTTQIAVLPYSSGTTGAPKGVELTHGNFLFDASSAVTALGAIFEVPDASTVLFLPLAHVFARDIQVACVMASIRVTHCPDVKDLPSELKRAKPSFVLAVPRFFEKIYNGAQQRANDEGKGKIFATAAQTAIEYSEALEAGRVSTGLRLRHGSLDRLVYRRLRDALGGNVHWAISGGAALGPRLGHFFRGIGVTVLEGYGLTETTAAATVNTPTHQRVGSVGRPLPGTEVAVSDDGEVWVRGPHVMRGYWPDGKTGGATGAVDIDAGGWLRTGDLGQLDDDGFLTITGRLKEILVTSSGKNVAPGVLEDRLKAHPLISQALVVGDGRPYVAALVTLDPDALPHWCEQRGRAATPPAELVDDPELLDTVQQAVTEANRAVSRAEAIKRFIVLPVDLTEGGGHLTPTLKVRRSQVAAEFADSIEALYT